MLNLISVLKRVVLPCAILIAILTIGVVVIGYCSTSNTSEVTTIEPTSAGIRNAKNIPSDVKINLLVLHNKVLTYRKFCTTMIKIENGNLSKETKVNFAKLQSLEKTLLIEKARYEID